ncbi:MAG TPA: long-chain fatty acid--CoA ligase [Candidatus Dormibacteraeota bacterium]|nr:long-chain fatty acid--CoA ligase [Candidatus Dormibacteraeota bacterium]
MTTTLHAPATSRVTLQAGTTLVQRLHEQIARRPDAIAFHEWTGSGWTPTSFRRYGEVARAVTAFLIAEGVPAEGHAAIWSGNRPQWLMADAGILAARVRPVPVYLTLSAEQAAYVLAHSESMVAFVEDAAVLDKLLSMRDRLPALRRVVVFTGVDVVSEDGFVLPWSVAVAHGMGELQSRAEEMNRRLADISPDDVATLVYTSGTTGPPKAAMLTHHNVNAAVDSLTSVIPCSAEDRVLSYLPLAHIVERLNSEVRQYVFGNTLYFLPSADMLVDVLRDIRPTSFFGVPRVWEKMAAAVQHELDHTGGLRGRIGRWAVRTGSRHVSRLQRGASVGPLLGLELAVADRLVLGKLRAALGLDQVAMPISGAAPISPDVLFFFHSIGLEICEGYGMTENCATTTLNRMGAARIGTVGPPLPGVEVSINGDGEIVTRGATVFAGYYKDPTATAETVIDGWLHTGDIGDLSTDGYLRITDRKKELIITAGGKNISPSNIEMALKHHPLVSNAVVIGDRRPYVSALFTLNTAEAEAFAKSHAAEIGDVAVNDHPAIREELRKHVDAVNERLANVEKVKRWQVLRGDFTVGEELTPTFKVRRKVVDQRYAEQIERNYGRE